MTSQITNMTSSNFLMIFDSLVRISYCFQFNVNIITGSRVMNIFYYKGFITNPEIANTLA